MKTKEELIDGLLDLAFAEDIGDGDHTTLCCIPDDEMGKQHLLIKEEGVLAGVDIALKVFKKFDPTLKVTVFINDGAHVKPGDIAFEVEGKVRSLLQTERLMLNIMQRMSGIATMTAKYAAELKGLKAKVLDTRKTTPGMRMLEKEAVRIGGGMNHRIGLFDMILLKDNHVDFAGGIKNAINKAHQYLKDNHKEGMQIEIEVRNFDELRDVLEIGGVDRIMLDNFNREYKKGCRDGWRTLRNRIIGRHHFRHFAQIRRMRRGLYISRRVDPFRKGLGYEFQGLLSILGGEHIGYVEACKTVDGFMGFSVYFVEWQCRGECYCRCS